MGAVAGRPMSCFLAAFALVLVAGCSASKADQVNGDPVLTYADAPRPVRTLLDKSGMEPELKAAGARLAVGQHVVVAGDVGETALSEMAHIGDTAVAEVDDLDGQTFHGHVLILAPQTQSDFASWGGAGYDDVYGLTRPPSWKGAPSVITLDLANAGLGAVTVEADGNLLRHVIAHEMFHALTLPVGGGKAPLWLTEGFAEVAGERMRDIPHPEVTWKAAFPTDAHFDTDPQDAYFLAWQLAAYLQHHDGPARAMRFYFAALSPHRHASLNALSRRDLGAPLKALVRRWKHTYDANGPIGVY